MLEVKSMHFHKLRFSGAILERGFWLYAWRIECHKEVFFYVGRTADSSSQYAASPFSRLGQHLNVRPNTKANMLLRHVRRLGLDPLQCSFELLAFGPIFSEQPTLELHRKYRDRIAPLESALAEFLRAKGCEVVGNHGSKRKADPELLAKVQNAFKATLDPSSANIEFQWSQ
jgi:hypothetical protein